MMLATDPNWAGIATVIGALGLFITSTVTAIATLRTHNGVQAVNDKVETTNGRSIGILAELSEGRRIRQDIPESQRTVREQAYVNLLEQVEREGSAHEMREDRSLRTRGEPPEGPSRT